MSEYLVKCIAAVLVGIMHGGIHGVWCLRANVPVLSKLLLFVQLGKKGEKVSAPPSRAETKWFLVSRLGVSSAGAGTAAYLAETVGVALFFIGAFIGFCPAVAALIVAFLFLLWNVVTGPF
jgi:hypothetical protein